MSYVGVHTGDHYQGSKQFTQAMSYIPNLRINGQDLPADWLAPPDPNGYPDYAWGNTIESWGGGEGFDPMQGINLANDGTFDRLGVKYIILDAAWYPRGNGTGTHNPGGTAWYPTAEEFDADPAYAGLTLAQQQTLYRTKQAQWGGEGNYLSIPGKWINVANYFGLPLSGPFDYEGTAKVVRAWCDYLHEKGFKTAAWCMPMSIYLHPGSDTGWSAAVPGTGAVISGRNIQIDTQFTEAFPDYLITANEVEYDPVTHQLMEGQPRPQYRRQTGYYPQNGTGELCLGNPRVLNEYTTYFANLIFDTYGFDGLKIDTQWGTQQCFAKGHGHDGNPNAGFENYSLFWKLIYDKGKAILGEDPWMKHCQCGTMMNFFTQNGTNRPITGDPGSSNVRKARYSIKMWKGLYGDNCTAVSDHVSNFGRRAKSLMAAGYVMESLLWSSSHADLSNEQVLKYMPLAVEEGMNKGYFMDEYKFGFDFPEGLAYARPDKLTTYFSFFASSAPVSSFTGGSAYAGGGETTMTYSGSAELRGLVPGRLYLVSDYTGESTFVAQEFVADANGIITVDVAFTECILLKAVAVQYTVDFETYGGSPVDSQTLFAFDPAAEPAVPAKEFFVFDGWFADEGFDDFWSFDTGVTADMTLFAKWISYEDFILAKNIAKANGGIPEGNLVLEGKVLKLVYPGFELILSTNANNRNIEGKVAIGGGKFLEFDIKGNGSNIKVWKIV